MQAGGTAGRSAGSPGTDRARPGGRGV